MTCTTSLHSAAASKNTITTDTALNSQTSHVLLVTKTSWPGETKLATHIASTDAKHAVATAIVDVP